MDTLHAFDDASVLGPNGELPSRWAGTEPQDWPDPYCHCGALWFEGRCSRQDTLSGAWWSLGAAGWTVLTALAELARALRPPWTRRRR